MAILRRPAELPREEWLRRWMIEHTPIAVRTQGTFGYESGISGSDPTCYCDATRTPGPAALLGLGLFVLAALPRPSRARRR